MAHSPRSSKSNGPRFDLFCFTPMPRSVTYANKLIYHNIYPARCLPNLHALLDSGIATVTETMLRLGSIGGRIFGKFLPILVVSPVPDPLPGHRKLTLTAPTQKRGLCENLENPGIFCSRRVRVLAFSSCFDWVVYARMTVLNTCSENRLYVD